MAACYATTMDNMYNPFTDYERWNAFDIEHKYFTNEWLAIFCKSSIHMDLDEFDDRINDAVNMLLDLNPFGIHYKVYESNADTVIPIANKAFAEANGLTKNKVAI